MNATALHRQVPYEETGPVRIRLTHSHGRVHDGQLVPSLSGIGLAEILQLDGRSLNWTQTREANECRLEWSGHGWSLRNSSRALVCAVNGTRLPYGKEAPLTAGDTLEVELLRLVVEHATTAGPAPSAEARPSPGTPPTSSALCSNTTWRAT